MNSAVLSVFQLMTTNFVPHWSLSLIGNASSVDFPRGVRRCFASFLVAPKMDLRLEDF